MKIVAVLLVVLLCFFVPFSTSNAYLQKDVYAYVTVKKGDDIWSIAKIHVNEGKDIREMVAAIYEINAIGNANHIYLGQVLKIPILYLKNN